MFKTITLAAFAALSIFTMTTATQAKVKTLADCYDKVIAWCNTQTNPQGCSGNGMNQCDKVFPTPLVLDPKVRLGDLTIKH